MKARLSIVNKLTNEGFILVLLLNRWAAKINIGPIYLVDSLLLVSMIIFPFKWLRAIKNHLPALIMLVFSTIWLLNEVAIIGDLSYPLVRRYALSVYYLIPVMYFVILKKIKFNNLIFFSILAISILGMGWLYSGMVFRVSLLAEILGIFFLHALFVKQKSYLGYVITVLLGGVFIISIFHTTILGQGGLYKTPLIAFLLSILIVWLKYAFQYVLNGKVNFNQMMLSLIIFMIAALVLLMTDSGHLIIAEIVNGIKGLLGVNMDFPIIDEWSGYRSRASSYGTASTRVNFWVEIIKYSLEDPVRVLVGNGHQFSFMEVVGGDFCNTFLDCELIEPHNSFMGIYFRYGLLGILLFVYLMRVSRKTLERKKGKVSSDMLLATSVYAVLYASFEVVLESPHGALIFWFIWLSPYYVDMSNLKLKANYNNALKNR